MSKNRQELKLDIISGIDEQIIDRNTKKRIKLFERTMRVAAVGMRRIVAIASAVAMVLLLGAGGIFFILNLKTVPVYEGMTVSTTSPILPADTAELKNGFLLRQMELFGVRTLDKKGQVPAIKETDTDTKGKDTSMAVTESTTEPLADFDPAGAEGIFYANRGEDFYITVHINNPENFEIVSFTLNGKKYSSYMFEAGSDMENLVLKCREDEKVGVQEYTIDAIKYIDGTIIKDVRMEGERTIRVGLYDDSIKIVTSVSNEAVSYDRILFDCLVVDDVELLKISDNYGVYARLYKDGEKISEKTLGAGDNTSVNFDGLEPDTTYVYAIEAEYDLLDGTGFKTHEIYKKEIATEGIIIITEGAPAKHAWNISMKWNDAAKDNYITSIELFHGETKIRDIPFESTVIDGLFADNEYVLKVKYSNDGIDRILTKTTKTEAYKKPSIALGNDGYSKDKVSFKLKETDEDDIGRIDKISLYMGDTLIETANGIDTRCFSNLKVNKMYRVEVVYKYNMNDNRPEESVTETIEIVTQSAGLEISDGKVVGIGSCSDSAVYINMPFVCNFSNRHISAVCLGENVTSIQRYAFEGGKNEPMCVYIPKSVKSIEKDAFRRFYSLNIVAEADQAPSGWEDGWFSNSDGGAYNVIWGAKEFYDDSQGVSYVVTETDTIIVGCDRAATKVVIPNGVTRVAEHAFEFCNNITSIILPNTVRHLDRRALGAMQGLKTVFIPDSVESWDRHVLFGGELGITIYGNKYGDVRNVKSITVDEDGNVTEIIYNS